MARLRAVVIIQPAGLGGGPSPGQRRKAVANASATASSARSMSPRTRTRTATALPYSARKTAAISSGVIASEGRDVLERADLDRQRRRGRCPAAPPQRRVQVG